MENPYKEILDIQKQHLTASQMSMQNALLNLSKSKKIYEVSVKELCKKASVARSTFYAYYQNIDDLLVDIENQILYILIQNNEKIMKREYQSKEDFLFYKETVQLRNGNHTVFFYEILPLICCNSGTCRFHPAENHIPCKSGLWGWPVLRF